MRHFIATSPLHRQNGAVNGSWVFCADHPGSDAVISLATTKFGRGREVGETMCVLCCSAIHVLCRTALCVLRYAPLHYVSCAALHCIVCVALTTLHVQTALLPKGECQDVYPWVQVNGTAFGGADPSRAVPSAADPRVKGTGIPAKPVVVAHGALAGGANPKWHGPTGLGDGESYPTGGSRGWSACSGQQPPMARAYGLGG